MPAMICFDANGEDVHSWNPSDVSLYLLGSF
eukprot:SAG31_NODE_47271_length_251_cov_0.664474_1_plen_30_part_01